MSLAFIAIKLLRLTLTMWAAVTLVFVGMRMAGDPLAVLVPPDLPDDVLAVYRQRLGLDRSLIEQYLGYIQGLLVGDFGFSFRTSGAAWGLVGPRIPATLALGGAAMLVAIVVGVPAGIIAAEYRDRAIDRAIMGASVFGYAMPNFFLGILLILLFTLSLNWLPSGGFDEPASLIMPTLTLGLAAAGAFARFTRSAMLEVQNANYMRTARAKGLPPWRRIMVHALPGALTPLTTLVGFTVGAMIGGAVVTETVFAWPGVGRLLVVSVGERDLAVVQLIVILAALSMSIANLTVDLAYGWLDPRIGRPSQAVQGRSA
jgi:peptide/nickel transport system permease protein